MKNEEVQLSIIIPVYNNEKFLARCLDSVRLQGIERYECIIVDDGSTDSSLEICRNYAQKNNEFKVIHIENKGVSNARNVGVMYAKGDYITFLDSDDYILKGCYKSVIKVIEEDNPDVVCFGMYREYDGKLEKELFIHNNICEDFIKYKVYMNAVVNKVIRRKLLEENRIIFDTDIKICEDMLYSFKALSSALRIRFIQDRYYVYFNNPCSACNSKNNIEKIEDFEKAAMKMKKYCLNKNIYNTYRKLVEYRTDEAALQYLINDFCFSPSKFRKIGNRIKIWTYNCKPFLFIITLASSLNLDIFAYIYAKFRRTL